MKEFQRDKYRYTEYFCEENIWWLARSLVDEGFDERLIKVLFFSNADKSILLSHQRAATSGQLIMWDYHVVLELTADQQKWIFDFDSRLHFPEPRDTYLCKTFPPQRELVGKYRSQVRIIPASNYLQKFHSDRSHMRGRLPGSAYPDYPMISPGPEQFIDITDYWDMQKNLDNCQVTSIESMLLQFCD